MTDTSYKDIFTYNAINKLKQHHPTYSAISRRQDINNTDDYITVITNNDITGGINEHVENMKIFNNYSGQLSTGESINMVSFFEEPYFKFKSNINLTKRCRNKYNNRYSEKYRTFPSGTKLTSSEPLQHLSGILENNQYGFFLFVNGVKLPDEDIFFYNNPSTTDIFLPKRYLSTALSAGGSDTFIVEERTSGSQCGYRYFKNVSSDTVFEIEINSVNKDITQDDIIMYIDGEFNVDNVLSMIHDKDNNKVTLVLRNQGLGKNIEIYVMNDIVYKYDHTPVQYKGDTPIIHISLSDYDYDPIYGPVTSRSLSMYYNGKKLVDSNIVQTSRLSFTYDLSDLGVVNVDYSLFDFYIEDNNRLYKEENICVYGPDYYLANMLGTDRCIDKLRGLPTNTEFDNYNEDTLSFSQLLSDDNNMYDHSKGMAWNRKFENIVGFDKKVYSLIEEQPHILREALGYCGNKSRIFYVKGNVNDIKLSSISPLEDDEYARYIILVNRRAISSEYFTTERVNDIDIITISKRILSEDSSKMNIIELCQFDAIKEQKNIFECENKTSDNGTTFVRIPLVSDTEADVKGLDFQDYDNIIFLKKIINEPDYIYGSSENIGYVKFKAPISFEIVTDIADGLQYMDITISGENYPNGFIVVDTHFGYSKDFYMNDVDGMQFDMDDVIIPLKDDDGYPIVNKGIPDVYINGKILVYGENFTYKTPLDGDPLACSTIILKINYKFRDVLSVVFSNSEVNVLMTYDSITIDNKYGLLYLSELPFPFSLKYLNLYINGEKMLSEQVSILSDKLIRVSGITRPIYSITVTTNFNVAYVKLQPIIKKYWLTDLEKILGNFLFYNADPKNEMDMTKPDVNGVYESFEDDVCFAGKLENQESSDDIRSESDLLQVMYLNWLYHSRKTKTYIFSNENVNVDVLEYFKVFDDGIANTTMDIPINCDKVYFGLQGDCDRYIERYPKNNINTCNNFTWETVIDIIKSHNDTFEERYPFINILKDMSNHMNMNILYHQDISISTETENIINRTGTEKDILFLGEDGDTLLDYNSDFEDYLFVDDKVYYKGKKPSGLVKINRDGDILFYNNGVLMTGYFYHEGKLYKDNLLFKGKYDNKFYIDGVVVPNGFHDISDTGENLLYKNGYLYNGWYDEDIGI